MFSEPGTRSPEGQSKHGRLKKKQKCRSHTTEKEGWLPVIGFRQLKGNWPQGPLLVT